MTSANTLMWCGFAVILIIMLILDLGIFSRKSREIKSREAFVWTLGWFALASSFNVWIYFYLGQIKALEFFTSYLIEGSLSVDNLFVFIFIFTYFKVGKVHQPKVLKWGVIGALVMRGIFIFIGIGLLARFHWMNYIFGGLLVFTGAKMAFGRGKQVDPGKNLLAQLVGRFLPVAVKDSSDRFFTKEKARFAVTPLFLTLLVVESSDIIFAMDSIPAILAVTRDPFIVYTSNIFAIMGLRSLYYFLSNVIDKLVYLEKGISFILAFIGMKMLIADHYPIPIHVSLTVIVSVLFIAVVASVTVGKNRNHHIRN